MRNSEKVVATVFVVALIGFVSIAGVYFVTVNNQKQQNAQVVDTQLKKPTETPKTTISITPTTKETVDTSDYDGWYRTDNPNWKEVFEDKTQTLKPQKLPDEYMNFDNLWGWNLVFWYERKDQMLRVQFTPWGHGYIPEQKLVYAILDEIKNRPKSLRSYGIFEIQSGTSVDNSASFSLSILSLNVKENRTILEDGTGITGYKDVEGNWTVAIDGTKKAKEIVNKISDKIIPVESKKLTLEAPLRYE